MTITNRRSRLQVNTYYVYFEYLSQLISIVKNSRTIDGPWYDL